MEGVKYPLMQRLEIHHNLINYLHPEAFITPKLHMLNVAHNLLVTLADVTQFSWGNVWLNFTICRLISAGIPGSVMLHYAGYIVTCTVYTIDGGRKLSFIPNLPLSHTFTMSNSGPFY